MSVLFQDCARRVGLLAAALQELEREARPLEVPPLAGREWYELLNRKLLPQLGNDSFLVVAVVGGTNIGKSVVFNHIAGFRASATSPLASGTKHPTALLPSGFAQRESLERIFPEFVLVPWQRAEQSLQEDPRHFLFWREHEQTPENLVILDTPDIDSVAKVNWERADHIRQSADVLVAVLTQQKYNDAAVKEFFRKAAQEEKLVLVVFNQVLLPEDEQYWPIWTETFCEQTGVIPHAVYLAPNNRPAAEAIQLPFYERRWPRPAGEERSPLPAPTSLMDELSRLRFGEIKLQTLTGSLRQLIDPVRGAPGWLAELDRKAREFREAQDLLSSQRLAQVQRWPTLPNRLLIEQIRKWWSGQREGWAATVHGVYDRLGQALAAPVKALIAARGGKGVDLVEQYRRQEWEAILDAVENVFDKLSWLHDLGNPLLAPRLEQILSGTSRAAFLESLKREHDNVDFERELAQFVDIELATFRQESPEYFRLFRRIDTLAAATRPALSLLLFAAGAGPVGHALMPAVADGALQGALHFAGDAVGGAVVTAVGDKVIAEGASTSAGYLEARFRQLHAAFARQRGEWVAQRLTENLFGTLPQELARAGELTQSPAYRAVAERIAELAHVVEKLRDASGDGSATGATKNPT